jgi:hypothetical protein
MNPSMFIPIDDTFIYDENYFSDIDTDDTLDAEYQSFYEHTFNRDSPTKFITVKSEPPPIILKPRHVSIANKTVLTVRCLNFD